MQFITGLRDIIPISLGYNCHVKVFIDRLGEREERAYLHQPFDWIGTPMWSICEIIESDFADMANREMIPLRAKFTDKPDLFRVHSRYNLTFQHDFGKDVQTIPESKWADVSEKYARRIERWKNTLDSGKHILFIRLEMDFAHRIQYPEFQRPHDEKHYVEHFAELMKEKKIPFTVLFLTTSFPKGFDEERNICSIQFQKKKQTDIIGADPIQFIIEKNAPFIQLCIRNSRV
jgi:hypothetical protein